MSPEPWSPLDYVWAWPIEWNLQHMFSDLILIGFKHLPDQRMILTVIERWLQMSLRDPATVG
jgi:hypothetical protein